MPFTLPFLTSGIHPTLSILSGHLPVVKIVSPDATLLKSSFANLAMHRFASHCFESEHSFPPSEVGRLYTSPCSSIPIFPHMPPFDSQVSLLVRLFIDFFDDYVI